MRILIALFALVRGTGLAFAQAVVAPGTGTGEVVAVVTAAEPSWWQQIFIQLQPTLTAITTGAIGLATAFVGTQLTKWFGQATSDRLTKIFQTSAENAAAWLIAQIGMEAAQKLKSGDPMLEKAVETQVQASIPDTLKKLGSPSKKLIGDKIMSWITKLAMNAVEGAIVPHSSKR